MTDASNTIQREEKDWGVTLRISPFGRQGGLKTMMRIDVDIRKPDGRRGPEIKVFFHSTAYAGKYISAPDARTWGQALSTILDEADKVAKEMQAQDNRPKKKATKRVRKKDGPA